MNAKSIIARKLLVTSICIAIYPIIMLLLLPPYEANTNFISNYMEVIDGIFGLILLHGALLIVYGLPISIGIEFLTNLITRIPKINIPLQHVLKHISALLLHLFFGLILFHFSLISAALFFLVDFILQLLKKKFTFFPAICAAIILVLYSIWVYSNTTNNW